MIKMIKEDSVEELIKKTLKEFIKVHSKSGLPTKEVLLLIGSYEYTIVHNGFVTTERFQELFGEVLNEVGD
jgi:hypothetical protein